MRGSLAAAYAWLDERFDLGALVEFARHKRVPVHRGSVFYYAGGVTAFLFLLQVGTGILLLMYYRVGTDASYESVRYITTKVPFGWLMRSVHSWGANLMVLFVLLHMLSVLFMKAYRKPRELTWLTGCALLGLSMAFGFSGYLLPWNELAYFATKVGTDIVGQVPLVGHWLLRLVRGGDEVTGATLSRFFGLHVAILPALLTSLMGVHLLFVQTQGMAGADRAKKTMAFFPNFLLRDAIFWLVVLNAVCALAVFFPWELGKKADALASAPTGIKPEWYFLSQYQFLKVLPGRIGPVAGELVGIAVIGAAGLVFALVPFWERLVPEGRRDRAVELFGWVSLAVLGAMTAWGYLS
ncbi:MAG: cytochrome b N-terminal domain-containing protein [Elusimicrobia bacterium]|nr:cytochrome b N-terminal domain-containing protein [Elusimicrobiota bacterium]